MIHFYQKPTSLFRVFILTALFMVFSQWQAKSQTTLAPGDLAFVGYISVDDGVDGTVQDDEFSFVLLKDITAGTVIRFTDFGWLTSGGFQTANPCGSFTGAINDGIITWTAGSALSCGTQVTIQCKYTLVATTGTVTGTQATANTPTAYISLANGGDQIFAYQGTHASPTFIGGISLNKAWDASLAACFFSSNSSILPPALAAGANNIAITGAINARYDCSVTNASPTAMLTAINNPANWLKDNTFFAPIPAGFQLPLPCSLGCNTSSITVTGTLNPFTSCAGTASAEQSYSVSATGLTANLVITAPAGFEISTTSGSGFTNIINLVPSSGTVASTTIYVRMAAGAAGTPSGNITHSSTGAATQNQPVSGTINPIPNAVATPASQTVCSGTPITGIVMSGAVPGTVYNWTRDNTVDVTGIAGTGSGNISGTLVNNTASAITVTFTITPVANNCTGASITATVTVNTSASVTCPSNITANNTAGQCGAIVNYNPTITGSPAPTVTYAFTGATTASGSGTGSGSFFNVGTTTVTLTATNSCGPSSCSFTITIIDNENPQITCPAPVSVSCAANVPAPNIASVTATDNCPGVSVSHISDVITNQTCANRYTITRTYRATDNAGNTAQCTQIITVNDQTAPTLTCPANVTVSCASQVPAPDIAAVTGVSDNCGGTVTVTHTGDVITNQTCANRYTITRTYRATDVCGNFAECTQTITVNDQTPPSLTCPANVTVSCASQVPAPNIAAVNGVSDNCGGAVTVTHVGDVITNQTCPNRYTITRTYRATDVCGNFAECTQTITVNDQTAPSISCPANVTVSCASQVPAANIASVTASDNCGGTVTVIHVGDVISNQTCANRYTITRTYRATDACGNFAECTQTITVNDQTPPSISCPSNVTVSCASQVSAANIASVTVSDNCGGTVTVIHVGDVITNQTCANRYTITRTYRATDVCGNFAECTQTITVNDQTPPTLTCPANVTVSCASQVPAPNIAAVTGVSDNCGGTVTVTHIGDVITNQTCANRYTITRTYRATDVCGNFAECTQTITVNDQTPPSITCPTNVTVSCAGQVPAPDIASVTVSDNCGGTVTVVHVGDVITNQTCANRYTITRTYRATDVCGNTATCTQIITVNDQTAPVITCPANITVTTPVGSCTAVVNYVVTATDNCGGAVNIVSSPASGTAFPIGTTTVTSTATDACGNSSTCTFTVTVIDAQLPVITLQPASQAACAGSNATFSVTATNATGYQWQQFTGGSWQNIAGATGSSYTVNNVTTSMNTNSFRVIVIGLCTNVTSNSATLTVHPLPNVTIHTSKPPSLLPGQFLNIIAVANPGGGSFAWYKNGILIPGATGPVLQHIGIDDLGTYYVVYTDQNGCVKQSASVTVTGQPSNNLFVYPNPNNGEFQVRYFNQDGESITVKVFDAKGAEVFSKKEAGTLPYTGVEIDITGVPAGNYAVVVFNGKGEKVGSKIVVIR